MSKTAHLRKYDVIMIAEDTNLDDIKNDSTKLPTDINVVTYQEDGKVKIDAVRSQKMSDVFDAYYDLGVREFESIKNGYGTIRPNLYNVPKTEEKE